MNRHRHSSSEITCSGEGNLSAVILTGGRSRRMNRDKAWAKVGDEPLIVRAVATAKAAGATHVFISGRGDVDYSALNCPVLLDLEPDLGPLGGIERALCLATSPLVLVLAVDLPHMTGEFLRKLIHHCKPQQGAVPMLRNELEPLAAIYPKCAHSLVSAFLESSRRAARPFAEECCRQGFVHKVPVTEAEASCFDNCNTPEDLIQVHGVFGSASAGR